MLVNYMHQEILRLIDNELSVSKIKLQTMLRALASTQQTHDQQTHNLVKIGDQSYYPVAWLQNSEFEDEELFIVKFAFIVVQILYPTLFKNIPLNMSGDQNDILWILNMYMCTTNDLTPIWNQLKKYKRVFVALVDNSGQYTGKLQYEKADFNSFFKYINEKAKAMISKLQTMLRSSENAAENHALVKIENQFYYPVDWLQNEDYTGNQLFIIKFAFIVVQILRPIFKIKLPLKLKGDRNDFLWILNMYMCTTGDLGPIRKYLEQFKQVVKTLITSDNNYNIDNLLQEEEKVFKRFFRIINGDVNKLIISLKSTIEQR